jgi:hypothetical protein
MKSKEDFIFNMCLTFNHGYACPGFLEQKERDYIKMEMSRLYEYFEPYLEELRELKGIVSDNKKEES